ncbi:hypothetical protein DM01DRAFT_1379446 [Hesseltinella vesiculosa]|uniref:Uncharacterized protein n=1 Tax=Hesseltinella vesiculosa TaxID=101127 RepID=A0A1X2GXL1_9FUNG|nr:hypothetical protein DM01DRAFT_1379446 [Hesseltinella vesiculosa]
MLQSDDTPVEAGQASESPSSSSQRHSPCPEDVVRATSPPGRRYLKPVNGIQVKGFARSAQRRSSVVTLGSIERLQHFYAKKDLVINKIGTLGFKKGEPLPEEDEEDDWTVDAKEPPPLWKDWDVETNLDALLATCFQDIQHALAVWALVTGPNSSMSTVSLDSESSSSSSCSTRSDLGMVPSFPVLPLVESVTKMIRSVKTYSLYRHDLPLDKLSRLRQASLALLSTIKDMEDRYRKGSSQDHPSQGDQDAATKPTGKSSPTQSEPGFLYQPPYFDHLGDERQAILDYLAVVEKNVLTPSHRRHHLAARRRQTSFTQEIRDLIISASASEASSSDGEVDDDEVSLHASTTPSISWFTPGCYEDDALGRYHAFLTDHYSEPIPSPHEDEDLFWEALTYDEQRYKRTGLTPLFFMQLGRASCCARCTTRWLDDPIDLLDLFTKFIKTPRGYIVPSRISTFLLLHVNFDSSWYFSHSTRCKSPRKPILE